MAGAVLARSARCRPSTRTASTRSTPSRSSSPRSGCWPSCRRSRRTPTRSRSASRSSTRDNSLGLRRELPADDVRRSRPSRTSSTRTWSKALDMLLILHADHEQNCSTSTVRLVGSSQANLFASVSAGINALFGPAARRRQPGGAGDARGASRRDGGDVDTFVTQGEEQGGRRPADGLRPPRLQELRPARDDHQGSRATTSSTKLGSQRRAARHRPASSRRSRSPTTTSSSASSTRTSTSTPA